MDREKAIKGLECHRIDDNHRINCTDCPYYVDDDNHIRCVNDLHDDALSLLKEQEAVVRCKDCKLYVQNRMFQCGAHCIPVKNPDWFCADGERK